MTLTSDADERQFGILVSRERGGVIVRVKSQLDGATTPRLALTLASLLGEGCTPVVLDLSGLGRLDDAGVWLVGEASRLFRARGAALVVRRPSRGPSGSPSFTPGAVRIARRRTSAARHVAGAPA